LSAAGKFNVFLPVRAKFERGLDNGPVFCNSNCDHRSRQDKARLRGTAACRRTDSRSPRGRIRETKADVEQ
jgi:hypothetical protein